MINGAYKKSFAANWKEYLMKWWQQVPLLYTFV